MSNANKIPGWFYWSEVERNEHGETLAECLRKYGTGTGGSSADRDLETKLLYLDASRSDSYSWLLSVKFLSTGEQVPAHLYEIDPDTIKVLSVPVAPPAPRSSASF
jgi:hypothetical protein